MNHIALPAWRSQYTAPRRQQLSPPKVQSGSLSPPITQGFARPMGSVRRLRLPPRAALSSGQGGSKAPVRLPALRGITRTGSSGSYSCSTIGFPVASVVPEPSAALLLGIGLAGMAGWRRRYLAEYLQPMPAFEWEIAKIAKACPGRREHLSRQIEADPSRVQHDSFCQVVR